MGKFTTYTILLNFLKNYSQIVVNRVPIIQAYGLTKPVIENLI